MIASRTTIKGIQSLLVLVLASVATAQVACSGICPEGESLISDPTADVTVGDVTGTKIKL